jgi:glutamate synthase domain-containing protein 3
VHIKGSAGPGVAENMMSGTVIVEGDASQYAGATGHGGLLVIKGNASSRCGISMKGIDIVVHGNIGTCPPSWRRRATSSCCGDAGEALGDSLYEARLFVRGKVKSLGCRLHREGDAARTPGTSGGPAGGAECDKPNRKSSRRYGSARKLYNFNIDNADAY